MLIHSAILPGLPIRFLTMKTFTSFDSKTRPGRWADETPTYWKALDIQWSSGCFVPLNETGKQVHVQDDKSGLANYSHTVHHQTQIRQCFPLKNSTRGTRQNQWLCGPQQTDEKRQTWAEIEPTMNECSLWGREHKLYFSRNSYWWNIDYVFVFLSLRFIYYLCT